MRRDNALLALMAIAAVAVVPTDLFYTSRFLPRFKELERQRIVTSNQLATAKIVTENLNHVQDLVYRNIDFAGQKDSVPPETQFFDFLTESVNDLKMKLVAVHPISPTTQGRVTTYGYDIRLEGDFFSLGELCSKFENSRRVMSVTSFEVTQAASERPVAESAPARGKSPAPAIQSRRPVTVRLRLETYRVQKG